MRYSRKVTVKYSVKFGSEESAKTFAAKVNGKVNDLRNEKGSRSKFSVTYEVKEKGGLPHYANSDFNYPNEFWQ